MKLFLKGKIFYILLFIAISNNPLISESSKIVVLCYHKFNQDKDFSYSVKDTTFNKNIKRATEKGFQFISEKDLYDFYYNNHPLKPLNLLITIDDGFKDIYTVAYPIFKKYSVKPLIFLNSEMIGMKAYLSWHDIISMRNYGVYFGNHSGNHFNLISYLKTNIDPSFSFLQNEIADSDKLIEKNIGEYSLSYAHPYGMYDDKTLKIIKSKYKLAFTTNKGPNDLDTNPLFLKRYLINANSSDDIEDYFDYNLLQITKSEPSDGGYFKYGDNISFYLKDSNETKKYTKKYFEIKNNKFTAYEYQNKIYFKTNKIRYKTFSISLICEDNDNKKYINSITVNAITQ